MEATTQSATTNAFEKDLVVLDWGMIDYKESLDLQLKLVDEIAADSSKPGYIIFCTHPPVVTLGRQTTSADLTTWDGETVEISRGGKATYHGPSQLVVYIILNVKTARKHRGPQEIRGFLRDFESAIVKTLAKYGLETFGRSQESVDDTGVWIQIDNGRMTKKITSFGIAVKKWVTYHGAAINMTYDPQAFKGINPCGYGSEKMISLEELLNKKISETEFKNHLCIELLKKI